MYKLKCRAYTLIEMIIVVIALWILLWMGIHGLTTLDANKYYSESCVNLLYGPLNEWVYYAATSKQLSGELLPDSYLIQKEAWNSGFTLRYEKDWKEEVYYTGFLSDLSYCAKWEKYQVSFSMYFDQIKMYPSLHSYGDENGFEILKKDGTSLTSLTTGALHLKFCSPSSENLCRDFWEIIFDARTAMIKKRFCKLYYPKDASDPGKEKKCKEWTTGN